VAEIFVSMSRFHPRQVAALKSLLLFKLVFLAALATPNLSAAEPAGRISGRITDPRGATVYRAQIAVSDQSKALICQTISDAQGYFFCPSIGTGEVRVTASAAEFAPVTMLLRVDPGARVEVELQFRELASQKQAITVRGVRDINVTLWAGSFFVASILTYMLR
jgi:hypothetical protein